MKFVTFSDMARTIRNRFYKVPHDVDFVIGIPRSGIIAASMVSEFLNAPLIDIDSFVFGAPPVGGRRSRFHKKTNAPKPKVLVIDDTIFHGRSLRAAKKKLEPFVGDYEFVYMVVYLEGPCDDVDVWLDDLRSYTENYSSFVIYEWNIFHHIPKFMEVCIYDIDGVFCVEPPDERTGQPYLDYISNAVPLFTPTVRIGEIVSYRLSIYTDQTCKWLERNGIEYGKLTLFQAGSWQERADSGISPSIFKANIYNLRDWAKLFVESSDRQARDINKLTHKPVYCVESNTLYE